MRHSKMEAGGTHTFLNFQPLKQKQMLQQTNKHNKKSQQPHKSVLWLSVVTAKLSSPDLTCIFIRAGNHQRFHYMMSRYLSHDTILSRYCDMLSVAIFFSSFSTSNYFPKVKLCCQHLFHLIKIF